MFLHRTRVELADFPEVTKLLRNKIYNKELLDYVMEKLYWAKRENSITYISLDRVESLNPRNGDQFTLEINKDEIVTFYRCWNNHHREKKVIKFNGEFIAVKCEESTDVVKSGTGLPSNTSRKSKTQIYHNNELFYVKEMESITESDIENLRSSSFVSETFINDEREAVERTISVGDEDAFASSGIEYSYSSSYEAPPFNSIDCNQTVFITGSSRISQEAFDHFIEQMKQKENHKLQKLN